VVTNHHVAPGATAEIELPGGERFSARVAARARSLDLVALEVNGNLTGAGLKPAAIRPSSEVRVGELVVAVGNPAGEWNAVTLGMVSANGPSRWPDGPRALLRVAITVWRGSSGGALADARGRLVGIPYMIAGPFALAVPSDVIEQFLLIAGTEDSGLRTENRERARPV
jgi:serine protease Do